MNRDFILNGNKLIVYFMVDENGICKYPDGTLRDLKSVPFNERDNNFVKYNNSWDWLMPVVEKINIIIDNKNKGNNFRKFMGVNLDFSTNTVYLNFEKQAYRSTYIVGNGENRYINMKQAVYVSCIDFINWYNKNKNNNENKKED